MKKHTRVSEGPRVLFLINSDTTTMRVMVNRTRLEFLTVQVHVVVLHMEFGLLMFVKATVIQQSAPLKEMSEFEFVREVIPTAQVMKTIMRLSHASRLEIGIMI